MKENEKKEKNKRKTGNHLIKKPKEKKPSMLSQMQKPFEPMEKLKLKFQIFFLLHLAAGNYPFFDCVLKRFKKTAKTSKENKKRKPSTLQTHYEHK